MSVGRFEAALQASTMVVRLDAGSSRGWLMMGLALKGLRRFDRSKIAFQRAIDIEIDSGSPGPIRETASRELVDIYEKTKDYESLADYLGFSIANEGPRQTLYFQAVVANLRAGRVEKAAERFYELERRYPDEPLLGSLRAQVLLAQGRLSEAYEAIDRYIGKGGIRADKRALGVKAKILNRLGRIEEATEVFRRILEIDPNNPIALSQIGYSYLVLGLPKKALPWLRQSFDLEPHNTVVLRNLVKALMDLEQSAELAKLASRMPQGEERSYIEAASSALRGHFSRALDQLESVTPTPRVQRLQARLHYLAGNPILAKQTLIQLIHNLENPDLFVIAALAKLERLDQPHDKFAASPMLKAVIESLTGSELKIVSQMTHSNFWTIKGDELPAPPSSDIANSFWVHQGIYLRPVDGNAVREITHQSHRND